MLNVFLSIAAEAGDTEAQHDVGRMLYYGEGAQKYLQKAFKWLQKGMLL